MSLCLLFLRTESLVHCGRLSQEYTGSFISLCDPGSLKRRSAQSVLGKCGAATDSHALWQCLLYANAVSAVIDWRVFARRARSITPCMYLHDSQPRGRPAIVGKVGVQSVQRPLLVAMRASWANAQHSGRDLQAVKSGEVGS